MKSKQLPSAALLAQCVDLDTTTGLMVWKFRTPDTFLGTPEELQPVQAQRFNTRWAAKPAFAAPHSGGYLEGRLNCELYSAHRVVFKLLFNLDPIQIDHINGVRSDNRPANLRGVSTLDNNKNRARDHRNTTGVTGVYFIEKSGRYEAKIGVNSKTLFIGSYNTLAEAAAARKLADQTHNFHSNHGRAA